MSRVLVPAHVASLGSFVEAGVLDAADVHFAAWVVRGGRGDNPLVALGAAAAAWAARHGHSCADLDVVASAMTRARVGEGADDASELQWPEPSVWVATLRTGAGAVVRNVETWDRVPVFDERPLVLHGTRLYLQRHWMDECIVAAALRARAVDMDADLSPGAEALLGQLLPADLSPADLSPADLSPVDLSRAAPDSEPNLQRAAADLVCGRQLAVIAGGPGTGKTYTVARLLAVLLADASERAVPLHIGLAAPTGKAAARLHESINLAAAGLGKVLSDAVRVALGELVPSTIHRLLGPLPPPNQRFRHHADAPLPHDIVIIDETSMVPVPLMARLVEALRPHARLVLVGDPDQLESVELGAALTDVVAASGAAASGVAASGSASGLGGSVVRLVRGHRFGGDSPIARLADAVRLSDEDAALAALRESGAATGAGSVRFVEVDDPMSAAGTSAVESLVAPALIAARAAALAGDAASALDALAGVRILCAHRQGAFGVAEWNRRGEQWLAGPAARRERWYAGRPLLVTRNAPRLGLVNGDTGIVVNLADGLAAVFATSTGLVPWQPAQLDEVETAYAVTVHKSQGSEYPSVAVVLPPSTSPLVGRELLYTAVTRARDSLLVVGTEESIRRALQTPARRMTGLADALRTL